MDITAYTIAAQIEDNHWWFLGRRAVLKSVIDYFIPSSDCPLEILEVGCGNGGNLKLLSSYGRLSAVELDNNARERAIHRGLAQVEEGWLPDNLPFEGVKFDLIAALDIIEHVDDEQRSIYALRRRLKSKGCLIITVPAYKQLWSRHDDISRHKHRYTRKQIATIVKAAGFDILYCSYFNTLLFPLEALYLKLSNFINNNPYLALKIPFAPINRLLELIFLGESRIIPHVTMPFGLSVLVFARLK
ncbi:MAG: class I SAM-dependent methyltransferase [Smithella sp.]